jgi:hypothetical protein
MHTYVVALRDKTQNTVLNALERIRLRSISDPRPKTGNGKEFTNNTIANWVNYYQIERLAKVILSH